MKVLMINKFLHPNGGSETYIFKIGEWLENNGHEVQYFGMEHKGRCVGNRVNAYTVDMDFHNGNIFSKLTYPLKTIYSSDARKKIRLILDDFQPDVCHINNFNYQLTPSIILEIKKWNKKCKIVYTAHDGQLVCPNHLMRNPNSHENCDKCLGGHYMNCLKNKCIHGSIAKSFIGTIEAVFWNTKGTYKYIDKIICCSSFMKEKIDTTPLLKNKTITLHNFTEKIDCEDTIKKDYVLYFGRLSEEKGFDLFIEAASCLRDIHFVVAGSGPLEALLEGVENVDYMGYKKGKELEKLIKEARFSVCPSLCFENCPFSVMESQMYGTPVLGADIGGIPELIRIGETGELFESGNKQDLVDKVEKMYYSNIQNYVENCKKINFNTIDEYYLKLIKIYK